MQSPTRYWHDEKSYIPSLLPGHPLTRTLSKDEADPATLPTKGRAIHANTQKVRHRTIVMRIAVPFMSKGILSLLLMSLSLLAN